MKHVFNSLNSLIFLNPVIINKGRQKKLNSFRKHFYISGERAMNVMDKFVYLNRGIGWPVGNKKMVIKYIDNDSGIFMVFFKNSRFAALNDDVGIREGIDMPVKHDSFAHQFIKAAEFKSLHIISNEITNQDFLVGAG